MPDALPRLAVLLAGPLSGETTMHNDLIAMHEALRERGVRPDEILALEGRLDRELVLAFLAAVRGRVAGWPAGDLFLYFSGHGAYAPLDAVEATEVEPALLFSGEEAVVPERWVFWHELFSALSTPPGVRLALLPDCWHTNLLAGRVPAGVTALTMQAPAGGELACRARNYVFGWGRGMQERGVISYYAARALPGASNIGDWLADIAAQVGADAHSGRLPKTHRPVLEVIGNPAQPLPGRAAV